MMMEMVMMMMTIKRVGRKRKPCQVTRNFAMWATNGRGTALECGVLTKAKENFCVMHKKKRELEMGTENG